MTKGTLDLPGSRMIIAGYVTAINKALEKGDVSAYYKAREELDRWLLPLAWWYLDHTQEE